MIVSSIAALQATFVAATWPSCCGIIVDFIAAWLPTCNAALQAIFVAATLPSYGGIIGNLYCGSHCQISL
jgi:hypothetical protein